MPVPACPASPPSHTCGGRLCRPCVSADRRVSTSRETSTSPPFGSSDSRRNLSSWNLIREETRDEFLGLLSTGMLEELRKAMIAGGVMREETVTKAAEHMSAHLRSGFSISS